jgi:hypothetical protein
LIDFSGALQGLPMDLFIKLFGDPLVFVYHCFDRIVIHGKPSPCETQ